MNKSDIVNILEEWQYAMNHSNNLVHVSWFDLQPQAQGFRLCIKFYIADEYDPELPDHEEDFYGSLLECFEKALQFIDYQKTRLRSLL